MCGIRNLRVVFGPLHVFFCNLNFLMNKSLIYFGLYMILAITITRFMFICVWKSMREMNDNLLSRFTLYLAVFMSLFFSLTVPRLTAPGRRQVVF